MAKKSSTIHVEEFVWKEVERIQKEQGISSRNTAFEYIIAKFKAYEEKSGRIEPIITNKSEHIVENEVKQVDELIVKLQQQEDDMPD